MKYSITFISILISISAIGQQWINPPCENLIQEIDKVEFESSKKRNLLEILINQSEEIVINGVANTDLNSEIRFKEFIFDFISNPLNDKNKAESPHKVYITLLSYNKKSNKTNKLMAYIQDVYTYLWDKASNEKYGSTFDELNCKKREKIYKSIPFRLINGEDQSNTKNKISKRGGVGVPKFEGDIKDN